MSVVVGLVTRERLEGWDIEAVRFHAPNMVSYDIFTGIQWTPLIRAYLHPANIRGSHPTFLEQNFNIYFTYFF